jgi:hypothetical protein
MLQRCSNMKAPCLRLPVAGAHGGEQRQATLYTAHRVEALFVGGRKSAHQSALLRPGWAGGRSSKAWPSIALSLPFTES